jgi:hypothetical protein
MPDIKVVQVNAVSGDAAAAGYLLGLDSIRGQWAVFTIEQDAI